MWCVGLWNFRNSPRKGSLLFETFIALMILSVGLTSTLRVFGEALFAGRRVVEIEEAKRLLDDLFFEWFAYPGAVTVSEAGIKTVPLSEGREETYWLEAEFHDLMAEALEEELESEKKAEQAEKVKSGQFYEIQGRVLKNQRQQIFGIDAVIYKEGLNG